MAVDGVFKPYSFVDQFSTLSVETQAWIRDLIARLCQEEEQQRARPIGRVIPFAPPAASVQTPPVTHPVESPVASAT